MKYKLLLLPALIAGAATLASAATHVDIDFEGGNIGTTGTAGVGALTNPTDTGNVFGLGTGNTIGKFVDASASELGVGSYVADIPDNQAVTLSFDAYINSTTGGLGVGFYSGGTEDTVTALNRLAGVSLSTALSVQTHYQVYLLLNRTGSAQDYWNPVSDATVSLANQAAVGFAYDVAGDVWNSLGLLTASGTDSIGRIAFSSNAAGESEISFDNLKVVDELTVVPEPSTYALAGAAGLVGLLALRRRRSK